MTQRVKRSERKRRQADREALFQSSLHFHKPTLERLRLDKTMHDAVVLLDHYETTMYADCRCELCVLPESDEDRFRREHLESKGEY